MISKNRKILLFAALFGAALYTTVYVMASRGDAFKFVEQKIKSSSVIESEIGAVEGVHLGSYEDINAGSDVWATMSVEVSGANKPIVLDIKAKKTNGTWVIEQATNNGIPIELN